MTNKIKIHGKMKFLNQTKIMRKYKFISRTMKEKEEK